jgi:FkbM family methyltransferase
MPWKQPRDAPGPRTLAQRVFHALPPLLASQIWQIFIWPRLPRRQGEAFVTRTLTGSLYANRSGDLLAHKVRLCGFWEWRILALAAEYCPPGGRIIEIGANSGTETIGFAALAGESGSVVAFEPEPSAFGVLERCVAINSFENVTLIAAAVSDRNGTQRFLPPARESDNSGTGRISQDAAGASDALEITAVTLDSLATEYGAAGFVSIDVEGHELAVLRGARRYLAQYRPMLVLEAYASTLRQAGQDLRSLLAELAESDYEAFELGKLFVRRLPADARFPDHYEKNWLCAPKERRLDVARTSWTILKSGLTPNLWRLHPLRRIG